LETRAKEAVMSTATKAPERPSGAFVMPGDIPLHWTRRNGEVAVTYRGGLYSLWLKGVWTNETWKADVATRWLEVDDLAWEIVNEKNLIDDDGVELGWGVTIETDDGERYAGIGASRVDAVMAAIAVANHAKGWQVTPGGVERI
jgi:hypothetical protein